MADQKYSNKELWGMLDNEINQYGGRYGQSFVDQYRGANAALEKLNGLEGLKDEQKDTATAALKGQKASAIAGGAIAGLQGATQIAGNMANLMQTADTSQIDNQIRETANIGSTNYGSYDQLVQDYGRLTDASSAVNDFDFRGMSGGEKAGNIASSTLAGASAGMSIGGPWGAAIGAGVGFIGSGVATIFGDKKAKVNEETARLNALMANDAASRNLQAGQEQVSDLNYRDSVQRRAALGGFIHRKKEPTRAPETQRNMIVRKHCAGGVMVRIKR